MIISMTVKIALSPVPMLTDARTAKRILKGFMSAENKKRKRLKWLFGGEFVQFVYF